MIHMTTYGNQDRSLQASIWQDDDTGEFVVKFYRDGQHQTEADYHTDDEADADGTAQHFVNTSDSAAPVPESKSMSGAELATFIDGAAPAPETHEGFRLMTNAEFATIVSPLIQRGIRFELALDGYWTARLTWNGGDTVQAVFQNGVEMNVAMPGVTGEVPA